jgi:2-polyprenyl-3-methyl-5-hydroxy-6-metoxy-1,4-benzoquinol methylase
MLSSLIPKEATEGFTRACEFKTIEILCGLITPETKILEIGCGTGRFISIPLGYLGASILGVDKDRTSIEYANRINPHSNVSFVCSPGESFKASHKFDLIICSHVLEHVSEPRKILQNIKALLKKNGVVFLGIPNGYGPFEIENFVPRILSKTHLGKQVERHILKHQLKDSVNPDSPHIQFFTVGKITKLVKEAGFKVERKINREILGGPISNRTILKIPNLVKWNTSKADLLPSWMATAWILLLRHADE